MAVRIRLKRMGAKKRPFYRLVVADSRAARDGRFIDQLGHYNPIMEPDQIVVDEERALEWLRRGAQPSDTARALLKKAGVWDKFKPSQGEEGAPTAEPAPAEQPAGEAAEG